MARQPPFWRLMERVAMTLLDQHKNRSDNIEEPATNTDQPVIIKTRRRASVRLSDIKLTPPTWLIHGILETQALAFMIGASGSGKTFAAVDMAVTVASGTPYHQRTTQRGAVIMSAGEGIGGLIGRFEAACNAKGLQAQTLDIFLMRSCVRFFDKSSIELFREELRIVARETGKVSLVIVDTLARAFAGADENLATDMGVFIDHLQGIIEEFDCSVLVLHHSGHDNSRGRGSSARLAAADCEILVKAEKADKILLTFEKMKDAPLPKPLQFQKVEIILQNDEGGEISSLALREINGQDKHVSKLSCADKLAIDCFNDALAKKQATNPDVACSSLTVDEWRSEFTRRHQGDNVKSAHMAHSRARNSLCLKGFIVNDGTNYSMSDKAT